jgi:hypothetical protein
MNTEDNATLITVLATRDPGVIAIAKSILDGAGIKYLARGDAENALFGGALVGFNAKASLVHIQVLPDDASDAKELLTDLADPDHD